jgi:hypothetical protein
MTTCVSAATLSAAWVEAFDSTLRAGGRQVNLVVSWPATVEDTRVRELIDEFLASRPDSGGWERWPMVTVANTIFPRELYSPELGEDALQEFSDLYLEGRELARLVSASGEYCERLVAWPGAEGATINQLVDVAAKLRRVADGRSHLRSVYEIAVADPSFDLRIQQPGRDRGMYGFPCLSHISLTVVDRVVHLTALYRNPHLVRKAYGNYLGLAWLAEALAMDSGLSLGEVTVVATHADAEVGSSAGFGRGKLEALLSDARRYVDA